MIEYYIQIKYTHLACVVLTFVSFCLRGYWMITGNRLLEHRLVRIVPHTIDTVLFLTGITMAVLAYGAIYRHTWLMLKLGILVIYIILGSLALRYGRSRRIRIINFAGALLAFFSIAAIARYRAYIPF